MNGHTERFYEIAAREVASKQVVPGIMAKAFADNNGEEKGTIATYIRLRVAQMEEQFQTEQQEMAQRRHTEAQRELARRDADAPPSLMRLLGRFYGRHPIVCWAIIIGVVMAFIQGMK